MRLSLEDDRAQRMRLEVAICWIRSPNSSSFYSFSYRLLRLIIPPLANVPVIQMRKGGIIKAIEAKHPYIYALTPQMHGSR